MPEPRAELGELWRSVNREILERLREAFRGCDLHFGVLFVLRSIHRQPGVTVGELTRQSGMVKSQVSKLVDQLVRRGYVRKESDPADQRLVRVYGTESGGATMAEMEERARHAWAGVMDAVPVDQLVDIERGVRILLTALEKANAKVTEDDQTI